jgi:hypothetical protein
MYHIDIKRKIMEAANADMQYRDLVLKEMEDQMLKIK